jgi:hypothetical protein
MKTAAKKETAMSVCLMASGIILFMACRAPDDKFYRVPGRGRRLVATNNKNREPAGRITGPSGSHRTFVTVLPTSVIVFLSMERLSCCRMPRLTDQGLSNMPNKLARMIRIAGKAKTAKKEAAAAICKGSC